MTAVVSFVYMLSQDSADSDSLQVDDCNRIDEGVDQRYKYDVCCCCDCVTGAFTSAFIISGVYFWHSVLVHCSASKVFIGQQAHQLSMVTARISFLLFHEYFCRIATPSCACSIPMQCVTMAHTHMHAHMQVASYVAERKARSIGCNLL
jgi:hypothetical protein